MSGEIIKLWFFSKIPQIYLVFPLNIKTLLISVIYDYFSMKYFIKSNTNQEHNDLLQFKKTKQKSRTIDIRNKKVLTAPCFISKKKKHGNSICDIRHF